MTEKRIIKRYTNRKLYDKLESRYVTLEEIARLVRAGEDIKVVDNETEEDLTAVTFAQIILEEEKRKTNLLSVPFLRKLIRSGEARMQDFSDRATRSFEALGDLTERAGERVRGVVEGGGRAIDELFGMPQKRLDALREAARKQVDQIRTNPTVRRELERIAGSLHTLEEAIARVTEEQERRDAAEGGANDRSGTRSATGDAGNGVPGGDGGARSADDDEEDVGHNPKTGTS
jgi:polyhydroxyalkanoate synthesis repressor PhaR